MSEVVTLKAAIRSDFGTGASRELRRQGSVPAIIYGAEKAPVAVFIEEKEITKYYRRPLFLSQQFDLEIDGKMVRVLPKEIQLNPITELVRHVDFVFLEDKKQQQKVQVPIVYANRENSIGIKRGGYFNIAKRTLNILCPVDKLPRAIEIDTTNIKIGDTIKAHEAPLPEGAKLLDNPKFVIASIIGKKGKSEETEEATKAKPSK